MQDWVRPEHDHHHIGRVPHGPRSEVRKLAPGIEIRWGGSRDGEVGELGRTREAQRPCRLRGPRHAIAKAEVGEKPKRRG